MFESGFYLLDQQFVCAFLMKSNNNSYNIQYVARWLPWTGTNERTNRSHDTPSHHIIIIIVILLISQLKFNGKRAYREI